MLIRKGLYYINRLGNLVHCTFLSIVFVLLFQKIFFTLIPIKYKLMVTIHGMLTGTIIPGQGRPGGNVNEWGHHTPQSSINGALTSIAV